ncbi:DUF5518 domain-containing protein [Halostagnicola bangensis]
MIPNDWRPTYWIPAIIIGLASIPVTFGLVFLFSDPNIYQIPSAPILFSGLLTGYKYGGESRNTLLAGFLTGAIGSIPILWLFSTTSLFVAELSQPIWFSLFQFVMLILSAIIISIIYGAIASIGSIIGDIVSKRLVKRTP